MDDHESSLIPKDKHHYHPTALASLMNRLGYWSTLRPSCTVPLCWQAFNFISFHRHPISNVHLYYHIFKKRLIIFMHVWMYAYMYVFVYTYVHVKVKEGVGSLRAGVTGPNLLHRNWDLNFSSHDCASSPLNHWTISLAPTPTFLELFSLLSY